jgi:hypothetical protein
MFRDVIRRLGDYTAAPDPLVQTANKVALIVGSNLPFYPLYLHWIVGEAAWPAWLSLLSVPGFAAVPWVTRRHSLAGRILLPVVGVANTLLCVKVLGARTGVELFLLPCVLLGAILFRPAERVVALAVLALPYAAYLFVDSHLGAPMRIYADADYSAMIGLNAISVASLTALIGLMYAGAVAPAPSVE